MERRATLLVDTDHGIQYRAIPNGVASGWGVQWRPMRAIRSFPTFSYITRSERFPTEEEALEFVRRNAGAIVSRAI
jgi:hypothetical protein